MNQMIRSVAALSALVVLAACQTGTPSATDPPSGTGSPGTTAAQTCDVAEALGLEALVDELADVSETTEGSEIAESSETMRSSLGALELEGDSDEWRDASIDALIQVERRIDDPDQFAEVARHAARTLSGLQSRICA